MQAVLTIAKRDMMGYLTSPKAAAVFFVFLILMGGVFFYPFVGMLVEAQQQAPAMGGEAPGIDQLLRAVFNNVHFILLLVVPGVCMGSFAEEKKSQSFRLLQTAPISSLEIVLGKFLGNVGVMFVLLLCTSVYPLYLIQYGTPDVGMILTSYLGLFLLVASQLSFGLWISSMTNNQFVAFLFTMFALFVLLVLNWVAPKISGGGNGEAIIKYLASSVHFESFLKGVVSVSDVTYFLCFTGIFLFFSNVVIDSQRWR